MKIATGIILLAGAALTACSAEPAAPESETPALESAAEPASAQTASGPADDPITALCLDMMSRISASECACGTRAFRASNENADTYADMASYYLNDTDASLSLAERWDKVVEVVLADVPGSKLQMSNALGKAHREALKSCEE